MKISKGTVSVKFESKPEPVTREVTWEELETADDVLVLASDKTKLAQLIKNANYGANLSARSTVRAAIMTSEAGPDKAVDKAFKDFNAARTIMGKAALTAEQFKTLMGA